MVSSIANTNNLILINYFHSSLSPIDWNLTSTATPDQSGPESDGNEGYSTFPKAPGLEPHHQID